jgi:hypothetical protein
MDKTLDVYREAAAEERGSVIERMYSHNLNRARTIAAARDDGCGWVLRRGATGVATGGHLDCTLAHAAHDGIRLVGGLAVHSCKPLGVAILSLKEVKLLCETGIHTLVTDDSGIPQSYIDHAAARGLTILVR